MTVSVKFLNKIDSASFLLLIIMTVHAELRRKRNVNHFYINLSNRVYLQ